MMKILFDTSVLIAAMVEVHPSHDPAFDWLRKAKAEEIEGFVCSHTLAETYAVLTKLPISPKISPNMAQRLIRDNLLSCTRVITLTSKDYTLVIDRLAGFGESGGVIYDALIVQAAKKAKADLLLTLNIKDFKRVWPERPNIIKSP